LADSDSSVGIVIRYGLDGPGIESWCTQDFSHPSRSALEPTQLPVQWVPRLSPGIKWVERGVDHPPTSRAEVKETLQLSLYSPSGPSWPVTMGTLPFWVWNLVSHIKTRTQAAIFYFVYSARYAAVNKSRDTSKCTLLSFMFTACCTDATCFGVIILPSSGSWHQNFFKTPSNKPVHNKHTPVVLPTVQSATTYHIGTATIWIKEQQMFGHKQ